MLSKDQIQKLNKLLRDQVVQKFGIFAIALLVIGSVSYFGLRQNQASHAAGIGVLSLSPTSGSFVVGNNVTVAMQEDSGTDPVNSVQAAVNYDATKLQFVSLAEGSTFPTVAATDTATAGLIRVARGTNAGTTTGGKNTVVTVTFKVLATSSATNLTYDPAFSYLVRSTDNANILTSTPGATYQLQLPAPTVSTVSPASGTSLGGTDITITGANFQSGATVKVGGTAATNVTVVSATSITATVPAHAAGAVDVVVTNLDSQTATKVAGFTYIAPNPTLSSVSPNTGLTTGGTTITITGANLVAPSSVVIGGTPATNVILVSSTQITAVTPAHAAAVSDVTINFPSAPAVTLTGAFTFTVPAPTISTVSPTSGLTSGGTTLTISGTNFINVTGVTVGGTAATGVTATSATTLSAVTPAHAAGAVSIVVTTATGSVTKTTAFTYNNPAPTVSSISPNLGTAGGGTVVTITGTNFINGATVNFGTSAATNVLFVSATTIQVTAPAGTGVVNVTVKNPDNQTANLAASYTYLPLGDANNDGRVNAIDLSILISHDAQNYPPADFNGDGTVGSADLAILLGRWTW
jgi:hypothetical protein